MQSALSLPSLPGPLWQGGVASDWVLSIKSNRTKQSDGEAPVLLELWRMQNTHLLPLLFNQEC